MSTEEEALRNHEEWLRQRCPNDLGTDHAWGWMTVPGGKNIFWLHRCTRGLALGTIDVVKPIHTLVCEEPLHVEPSILCPECGDHGYIHDGVWRTA